MKVIFDTNIYRDIQRGFISESAVNKAIKRLEETGAVSCVSPISLIELGSHIIEENKDFFHVYQAAFKAIVRLCKTALPDPETFMRENIFHYPKGIAGLQPTDTMQICSLIAKADSYEDLIKKKVIKWNGVPAIVSYNNGFIHNFRSNYETQFINDMLKHVVSMLVPDYKEKKAEGLLACIDDPILQSKVKNFIDSRDFDKLFYLSQADRAGVVLLESLGNTAWDEDAWKKLEAFSLAYKWIIKKVTEGYNVEKNKNDYNDLHFLIYLADSDVILVTHDGGIVRKIGISCEQTYRVKSFNEWLDS